MNIERQLQPKSHDLGGGMIVRRLLPSVERQSVGPFVFFDHFGPLTVTPASQFDVRPHPHIGLATVTYLFDGAMVHRDSLGYSQRIEPGAVNWMTAGRGIVHSERRPEDLRARTYTNHGLQLWAALPIEQEEAEPAFFHTPAGSIPSRTSDGVTVRVLVGKALALTSPVHTHSETLYLDVQALPGSRFTLEPLATERAVYSVDQALDVDGTQVEAGVLAVIQPGASVGIAAPQGARYVVVGGAPLDARRHLWWNFVSSSRERIEQAKRDWAAQRMGTIAGDTEFIPLPVNR
jgi:redox-sensitive bicupin YhaK (pirin superfamily)